jgi:hypothetical protein
MPTWAGDLEKEEARLRILYKLLHGLVDEDIRNLHIPGDVRTKLKRDLEIKGWNRNDWLPLETWGVLEKGKRGWTYNSVKLNVWFIRAETQEALGIPMEAIRNFLELTVTTQMEELKCACGKVFIVTQYEHPLLIKQDIQWSNGKGNHKYHSACLFVKPEVFPMRLYHGKQLEERVQLSYI